MKSNKYKNWLLISLCILVSCPLAFANVISKMSGKVDAEFTPLIQFGDNPGELLASYYATETQPINRLIVLLHGCGQNAEHLASQTGLLALARTHHFSLLLPQQVKSNNATLCFNWFSKLDQIKQQGETLSIMNMVAQLKADLIIDQVFIIGLSAGGAMASNLLSQYPQQFSAGSVIAGIPFPCADDLIKAISCMKVGSDIPIQQQADLIKNLNPNVNTWPDIIIFSGGMDGIVSPKNSNKMAQLWSVLHQDKKLQQSNGNEFFENEVTISKWGAQGNIELIELHKLGHGFPVNPDQQDGGHVGPFIIKSPISAAQYVVLKWIM